MPGTFNGQPLNRWYKGRGGLTADDYDWATSRKVCMGTCVTPTPAPTNTPITPSPTPTNTPVTPTVTDTPTPTPTNVPPTFGATPYRFSVAENAAINTSVGAVSATDQNGDEISYSIVDGNTAGKFGIGTTNGNITLAGSLDHETTASYSLTARANDGKADTDVTVAINVRDVNEPPDAPATPTVTANGSTSLTVTWQPPRNTGPDINDYDVQHRVSGSGSFADAGYDGAGTTMTIDSLSANTTYQVQVRAKNDEGNSPWSDSGTGKTSPPPKLSTPTVYIEVRLRTTNSPQRVIETVWNPVDNATSYHVEMRDHLSQTLISRSSADSSLCNSKDAPNLCVIPWDINSYPFNSYPSGIEFRVQARDTRRPRQYEDSAYSETITVVDNPTQANGYSSSGSGEAVVKWVPIPGVTSYTIRYRKLNDGHSSTDWRPGYDVRDWSKITIPYDSTGGHTITPIEHTITPLQIGAIYAIQLNYEKPGNKFFSGRNTYVWPAREDPDYGDIVAGFQLKGRLPNDTYAYHICENTFPDHRRTKWVQTIEHALEEWELATKVRDSSEPLVTVTHIDNTCADYTPFIDRIASEISIELAKQNPDIRKLIVDLLEKIERERAIVAKIDRELNEILMFDNVTENGQTSSENTIVTKAVNVGAFPEFSSKLGYHECSYDLMRYAEADACAATTILDDSTSTVDIFIRRGNFINDALMLPGDFAFDSCPAPGNSAYETFVHEAGHALGIGIGSDHPHPNGIIPSTMNYNFNEPDCSPHPLDVLALYAIYQASE